jgi:hypothetical protein
MRPPTSPACAGPPARTSRTETRSSCVVERTAMEGGFGIVASARPEQPGALLLDQFRDGQMPSGGHRADGGAGVSMWQLTGTTVRNTIMVRPDTPMLTNAWLRPGCIRSEDNPEGQNDPADPVEIYANTLVNLMSDANRAMAGRSTPSAASTCSRPSASRTTSSSRPQRHRPSNPRTRACRASPWPRSAGNGARAIIGPRYRDLLRPGGAQPEPDTRYATPPDTVARFRAAARTLRRGIPPRGG